MYASRTAAIAFTSVLLLAACGGGNETMTSTSTGTGGHSTTGMTSTGGAGGAGGGGPFMTADHDPEPQVATFGGPVIASPKVQMIMWANDPFAADIDKFIAELKTTSTWHEQTAEYGVGDFTALPSIKITDAPPTMLDDNSGDPTPFMQYLAGQLSGPSPAWGAADASTIYMFVLPEGTDINSGGHCCSDFLGYHYEAKVGTTSVPYGIACHCPMSMGDTLTPLQYVTTTVIHELVESATDPYFVSNAAYAQNDDDHLIWTYLTGGEVSDMCEYDTDSNITPAGATYMIQRSWSNAAAKAGKQPCVPVPAGAPPYFNSMPALPDTVTLDWYGSAVQTKGVHIPVGQTKTIDLKLFSEAETGPWTVTAYDLNDYLGTGTKHLDLSLDKTTGKNGDVLKLTIKVLSKDANLGGEGFVISSTLNGTENTEMGAVGN
jgi:hypothetical protein